MITYTLNLNPNATYPILAREGLSSPGIVPVLTVGDKFSLKLQFWEGSQGTPTLTNKRLDGLDFIKFGSKVSKASASLVIYTDEFTEVFSGGIYSYNAELDLNTVQLVAALDGMDSLEVYSDVEINFTDGQRQTLQFKHIVRNQVVDNANPPSYITEPTAIVFSDLFDAYVATYPGSTMADFLSSLQSEVPGPAGEDGSLTTTISSPVADFEILPSDANKTFINDTSGNLNVTINTGSWISGSFIEFINLTGTFTIIAGSGMTVMSEWGLMSTGGDGAVMSCRFISSTLCVLYGSRA